MSDTRAAVTDTERVSSDTEGRPPSGSKKAFGPRSAKVLNAKSRNVRVWLPPSPHGRRVLARSCHSCGELRPEDGFYGKSNECAKCHTAAERARNAERVGISRPLYHRGAILVAATCKTCHRLLMADRFHRTSGAPPLTRCIDCRNTTERDKVEQARATAHRKGLDWTGPELEIADRDDLTALQVARMLGRTKGAVEAARRRLRTEPREDWLAGASRKVRP